MGVPGERTRKESLIRLNEEAFAELRCEKELKIVPGPTYLFEEPGALEAVANLPADWFHRHFQTHSESDRLNGGSNTMHRGAFVEALANERLWQATDADVGR